MDIFTRVRWLKRSVFILSVLNIGLLAFGSRHHSLYHQQESSQERVERAARFMRDELGLSSHQERQLRALRADFQERHVRFLRTTHEKRDSMSRLFFSEQIDTALFYQLAQRVAEETYESEYNHLLQAQELHKICKPHQFKKFHNIMREMRDYFKPPPPPERKQR